MAANGWSTPFENSIRGPATTSSLPLKTPASPLGAREGVAGGGRRESVYKILMHITSAHLLPIAALVAGLLVLFVPRVLSFVVGAYLIIVGLVGLNGIYHIIK